MPASREAAPATGLPLPQIIDLTRLEPAWLPAGCELGDGALSLSSRRHRQSERCIADARDMKNGW
jgi:hypothetical protein